MILPFLSPVAPLLSFCSGPLTVMPFAVQSPSSRLWIALLCHPVPLLSAVTSPNKAPRLSFLVHCLTTPGSLVLGYIAFLADGAPKNTIFFSTPKISSTYTGFLVQNPTNLKFESFLCLNLGSQVIFGFFSPSLTLCVKFRGIFAPWASPGGLSGGFCSAGLILLVGGI